MKKTLLAWGALAMLAGGCGEIKNQIQDALAERAALARESTINQAFAALDAVEAAQLDDDIEAYLDDDELGLSGGAQGMGPALAPESLAQLAPGAPGAGAEITLTRYNCTAIDKTKCRPATVTAKETLRNRKGETVGTIEAVTTLHYHTAVTNALSSGDGDKDTAWLARDSYVRADFTVKRGMTQRDGTSINLTTAGHRMWSLKTGEWFVLDLAYETTGFPVRDGRPNVTSVTFTRNFAAPDVADTSGSSHRVVSFADDTTVSTDRYLSFERASGIATGNWVHRGRLGFVGEGTFEMDTKGTPFCRLDDVGTVTIDRTFGEAVTRITSEHLAIEKDGGVVTVDGALTLADGTTRTKSLTRTRVSPTGCTDAMDGRVREFKIEGTTYRGAEISIETKRSPGSLQVHAERIMPNGNVQTLDAVRSEGVLNLQGSVVNAAGEPVAEVHIVVHPDGSGQGQVTRWVDGEKVTKKFAIENGRPFLVDENGKKEEVVEEKSK